MNEKDIFPHIIAVIRPPALSTSETADGENNTDVSLAGMPAEGDIFVYLAIPKQTGMEPLDAIRKKLGKKIGIDGHPTPAFRVDESDVTFDKLCPQNKGVQTVIFGNCPVTLYRLSAPVKTLQIRGIETVMAAQRQLMSGVNRVFQERDSTCIQVFPGTGEATL